LLFFTLSAFAFFLRAASSPLSVLWKNLLSPLPLRTPNNNNNKNKHTDRVFIYVWSRYWGAGAKNIFSPALKDDDKQQRVSKQIAKSTHIQKINVRRE